MDFRKLCGIQFAANKVNELKIRIYAEQLVNGETSREHAMKQLTQKERAALWSELDSMAQKAAGLATYFLTRGADGGLDMGHATACKREAAEVKTIRSIMGYAEDKQK